MKAVNMHQVTQRWAVMMNWPLLFAVFYFALTFVSHDGTVSGEIKCLCPINGFAQQGCKRMSLE